MECRGWHRNSEIGPPAHLRVENNIQNWMQLDDVWCGSMLAVREIEKTYSSDLYRNVGGLKRC
jgi:hypothetical protein